MSISKRKNTPSPSEKKAIATFPKAHSRPLLGLFFFMLGILTLVALVDYNPQQSPEVTTDAKAKSGLLGFAYVQNGSYSYISRDTNLTGKFGVSFAFWSLLYLGTTAWLLSLSFFWLSYMFFFRYARQLNWKKGVAFLTLLFSGAVLASMIEEKWGAWGHYYASGFGGVIGDLAFKSFFSHFLGFFGSSLVLTACFLGSAYSLFHDNLVKVIRNYIRGSKKQNQASRELFFHMFSSTLKALKRLKSIPEKLNHAAEAYKKSEDKHNLNKDLSGATSKNEMPQSKPSLFSKKPKNASDQTEKIDNGLKIIAGAETRRAAVSLPQQVGDYHFPSLDLLDTPTPVQSGQDVQDHQAVAQALLQILDEFGVKVSLGEVHAGPVITRYDIHPASGVRVEKILSLDKNIALGLKALSVRILAPVPGKGCVGIEVPNKNPQSVCLRDILESEDWVNGPTEIPVALGKKVSGEPLIADLTKMPHLLIAGSTGAGKTVCINAVISSLLYKSSPEDLRFVMIDPKIVEMQVFNDLPHMLIPVVTEPKKVPPALKYLIKEMEKRYKIFAKIGVRNIAGFNAKRAHDKKASEQEKALDAELSPAERIAVNEARSDKDDSINVPDKLPYIVCIVDELADLMMVAPADIETCIARLAQLARAAGIHLILATQRPSVNVITGVIKANLPSRIAFRVASKVDSRTILDAMGADHLIGKGDMLFLPPGSADLIRSQGAFVSDDEINAIVDFLKRHNGEPQFDEIFQQSLVSDDDEEDMGEEDHQDELLPDAIDVLRSTKRASTSMLQRRLRIGYNRAARIMEILEEKGIVGPDNGAQPREILKDLDVL